MAGFFKGMFRAITANYGDLEGPMTNRESGRLAITIAKGKCIAWNVGKNDVELSKDNVKSVEMISGHQIVKDLLIGRGETYDVNVYKIKMRNGQVGTLRLISTSEYKVLQLIK